MIRPAQLKDLDVLMDIENRSFDIDRLTRRSFRYLLTRANAETLVYEDEGRLTGYVMVLFNTGTIICYGINVSSQ